MAKKSQKRHRQIQSASVERVDLELDLNRHLENSHSIRSLETLSACESTELQRKQRDREESWGARHFPRCKACLQNAANYSSSFAVLSQLRTTCEVMVAEGVELYSNILPQNSEELH